MSASENASLQIDALVRDHLGDVLHAAVKEYAARVEAGADNLPCIDRQRLTATEAVVVATELIRAMDLNLFDVAMWFQRPTMAAASSGEQRV